MDGWTGGRMDGWMDEELITGWESRRMKEWTDFRLRRIASGGSHRNKNVVTHLVSYIERRSLFWCQLPRVQNYCQMVKSRTDEECSHFLPFVQLRLVLLKWWSCRNCCIPSNSLIITIIAIIAIIAIVVVVVVLSFWFFIFRCFCSSACRYFCLYVININWFPVLADIISKSIKFNFTFLFSQQFFIWFQTLKFDISLESRRKVLPFICCCERTQSTHSQDLKENS